METIKDNLDIDEYSASQTTLEQIFNGFARVNENQVDERTFNKEILKNIGLTVNIKDSKAISFDNGDLRKKFFCLLPFLIIL